MNGSLGAVLVCLAEGAGLDNPAVLHHDVHVVGVEHVDVGGDVTVDDQQVGALAGLDGTGLVLDVAHLGTVEGGTGDGLDRGEADLVDELVHLFNGAGAVRGDEGEGVGADRHDDAALLGLAQAVVVALQLLLDQGALVLVVQLGDVDGRIGGVPGGQEGDRRGEEGALLGHEVHVKPFMAYSVPSSTAASISRCRIFIRSMPYLLPARYASCSDESTMQ